MKLRYVLINFTPHDTSYTYAQMRKGKFSQTLTVIPLETPVKGRLLGRNG